MMSLMKNRKGQSVAAEYALTFALILATIITITVYFKRAIQSRFFGANNFAGREVGRLFDEGYDLAGRVVLQYEPYYIDSRTDRTTDGTIIDRRSGAGPFADILEQEYQDYRTDLTIRSNQLAPRDAY